MTVTYGELVTRLRDRLDEVGSERQWGNDALIRWLYDGAKDVARKTECLRTTSTIAAVAQTQQYTMPTDIIRCHRVEWQSTGSTERVAIEYRDFMSMDAVWWTQQATVLDTPALYTMWGAPPSLYLVLYPNPSVAGTIKVFYYKLPTDPANVPTVVCDLPAGWEDLAIDYATYYALLNDRDDLWQSWKSIYEEHVEDVRTASIRYTDQAGMMPTDTGMVPRFIWDEGY